MCKLKPGYLSAATVTFILGIVTVSVWIAFRNRTLQKIEVAAQTMPTSQSIDAPLEGWQASPIRAIDFANFTYPRSSAAAGGFKLIGGCSALDENFGNRLCLNSIKYGDVTGDENEDAIIQITHHILSSNKPIYLLIFAEEHGQAKMLASFYTGEKSNDEDGLRDAYAQNNELVIELNDLLEVNQKGHLPKEIDFSFSLPPCFTRARYEWKGKTFRRIGRLEFLPLPTSK